jgi:hypothetical protein
MPELGEPGTGNQKPETGLSSFATSVATMHQIQCYDTRSQRWLTDRSPTWIRGERHSRRRNGKQRNFGSHGRKL